MVSPPFMAWAIDNPDDGPLYEIKNPELVISNLTVGSKRVILTYDKWPAMLSILVGVCLIHCIIIMMYHVVCTVNMM